jgi:hypothetical protein
MNGPQKFAIALAFLAVLMTAALVVVLITEAAGGQNANVKWKKTGFAVVHGAVSVELKAKNRTGETEWISCRIKLLDSGGKKIAAGWTKAKEHESKEWRKHRAVVYRKGIHEEFDSWVIKRCVLVDVNVA